jgi:hypothetical protein
MSDRMFPFAFKIDPSLPTGAIKVHGANGDEILLMNIGEDEVSVGPPASLPETPFPGELRCQAQRVREAWDRSDKAKLIDVSYELDQALFDLAALLGMEERR